MGAQRMCPLPPLQVAEASPASKPQAASDCSGPGASPGSVGTSCPLFVLGSSEGLTPSVSSSQVARSERGELFP